MPLKEVTAELQKLAAEVASIELDTSARLFQASEVLRKEPKLGFGGESPEVWEEERKAIDYLNQELDKFPKGNAWWNPPRNIALNQALMAWNLWEFSILPLFPAKKAYREDLGGIIIHPIWHPYKGGASPDIGNLDMESARKIVAAMKTMPTIQDRIRKELRWYESQFKISIPSNIENAIIKDAEKTAQRRWSVNRLNVKDRLIPLDGSKPRDLSSWG